ncbi:sialidase family protein [Segetibacter koreensis]|uniref:sialidase family protein n=1 Tax=Segetibacter koreensis TaxID=398037 RepID=UPI000381B7B6|nr:sialidase family protein [Segetibacter koreensis]
MRSFKTLFIGLFFLSFTCRGQNSWRIAKEELIFNNPPFAQCHASTIVEVKPGKRMVAYFAGTGEGHKDVSIWLSVEEKGKWNVPVLIADGVINDTLRYPSWNPVLFKAKEGKLFLFYKVGPSPREWWGMVRTSTDDGKTWTAPQKLPDGILGPIKNKPVQLSDGTILAPSSTETRESWKVHIEKSTDLGATWQSIPVDPNTAFDVIQPSILFHPGKRLQIVCRSKNDKIIEAYSEDNGNTWGTLSKTDLPNPNSGIDAVTLKNGWQLLVYNPTKSKEVFNERAKLNVAVSKNGKDWTDVAILENGTKEEYSYPAVIETKDGKVHITYTYDRKNVKHVVLESRGQR